MTNNVNLIETKIQSPHYDHSKCERKRWALRSLLKSIGFTALAKLDRVNGLENVPIEGPAILMINHIALIDPIVVIHCLPRNIVPLAKIEVYDYPIIGIFPKIWEVIPVRREEFDRRAIQMVMEVLKAGEMVLVAPEGTRGQSLGQGKEGIAYLASRSGVPVIPVAIDGTQNFPAIRFSNAWRGPGIQVTFGRPFRFRASYCKADRDELRMMTDEAMYILASYLPEHRRGLYSDQSKATQDTIENL